MRVHHIALPNGSQQMKELLNLGTEIDLATYIKNCQCGQLPDICRNIRQTV